MHSSRGTLPRRYQFTLTSLGLFIVLLGFGFSYLGYARTKVLRRQIAINKIREVGGQVVFSNVDVLVPEVVGRLFDSDLANEVTEVYLWQSNANDSTLVHLDGLTCLELLDLRDTCTTDAGLVHVSRLTNMLSLQLSRTEVTDEGIVCIADLTGLKYLELGGTGITDCGVRRLSLMTKLESLELSNTRVTDACLAHLAGLTELKLLAIDGTEVTDAGLAHVARFSNLRWVWLGRTRVTDRGIEGLRKAIPGLVVCG